MAPVTVGLAQWLCVPVCILLLVTAHISVSRGDVDDGSEKNTASENVEDHCSTKSCESSRDFTVLQTPPEPVTGEDFNKQDQEVLDENDKLTSGNSDDLIKEEAACFNNVAEGDVAETDDMKDCGLTSDQPPIEYDNHIAQGDTNEDRSSALHVSKKHSSDKEQENLVEEFVASDSDSVMDIADEIGEPSFPKLEVFLPGKMEQTDDEEVEEDDKKAEPPTTRHRFFPLLYTFRTLFTSFLADFGDDGNSEGVNKSSELSGELNMTANEVLDQDTNSTVNGSDAGKKSRFQCAARNISENVTGEVKIVNSTELLEILNFSKNQKVSPCVLVLFYAPWCHFCAMTAPHYNALARAYPQLDILAVDTSHFSYLNARFGTVAVPNVMLFHSRSAVRFNHTMRTVENFIEFVANNTGLEPNVSITVEPGDFLGPLSSEVVKGRDWLLWLAWVFVIACSGYGFVRSRYAQGLIMRLRVLWQEHQHIE